MTNPAPAETITTDEGATDSQGATDRGRTRRAVLGLGAFGTVMAAARTASAGAGSDPSAIAEFAMAAELTASELYRLADGDLWTVMAAHHDAYAERIAGIAGLSARGRNDAIFDQFADGFSSGDPSDVAIELENTLAATHTSFVGEAFDLPILSAIASIAIIESRHAATIAAVSGADLDTQLVNSAAALAPEA